MRSNIPRKCIARRRIGLSPRPPRQGIQLRRLSRTHEIDLNDALDVVIVLPVDSHRGHSASLQQFDKISLGRLAKTQMVSSRVRQLPDEGPHNRSGDLRGSV
jgi:hypothetical protein